MNNVKFIFTLTFIAIINVFPSGACTNLLVTKGASADGSSMISYAADSHVLYGELYFWPAAKHKKGAMLDVYEWDTGKYLGQIKQVAETYQVVGNMNEHQVAIGETTYGGRKELKDGDSTAIMDYGSLMYIALQRSKTAREAIEVMTGLVDKYGYYSSGESFSIADPNEVWILELIGKGMYEKGAVWVTQRIPDGYVSAHANQARITTFPKDDPENCLYSKDVVSFAKKQGWYEGPDDEFSFSDVYAPLDYGALRFCEARVWSFFNNVNEQMIEYLPYVTGDSKEKMPLWIQPEEKLTVQDVQKYMRDHFEGTALDMTKDIGAGPFGLPYRWRPLTWEVDSVEYLNERAIATQQTGFSFVSQSRADLPDAIGGVLWFGVDDAASTVYVPMYCSINQVPEQFREGNGDLLTYSPTSAFWIFNRVANKAYQRYNYMIEDIKRVQSKLENDFKTNQPLIEKEALALYNNNPEEAAAFLTEYSLHQSWKTFREWNDLSNFLLVKYIDGNIKKEEDGEFIRDKYGETPSPEQPGYSEEFYRMIIENTGKKLEMKNVE